MKFYVLKDQLINLKINEEVDYSTVVRYGTYKMTNIIPSGKGSPVADQICKKLNNKLTGVLTASSYDDSGCSSKKRRRVRSKQDHGAASLYFELGYHKSKKRIEFDGKVTGVIKLFKTFLQVEPENIKMKFKGSLKFEETREIGDTSNPINCFGSLATQDHELFKRPGGSYGFIEDVVLKADRSNWNSELSPRKLWQKGNLSFTGIFTMTLTVEGVNKKLFMDKGIVAKMSIPKKIFTEKLDCDVKIVLDNGEVIRCHRAILSANSQVFASMLNGNFVEGTTNEIKLAGKSEEAIRALLAYLYDGDKKALYADPGIAVQLFKIAHEYDIKPLENCMVKILTKKCAHGKWLDMEMAISLFPYVGSRDDLAAMKSAILEFFVGKGKEMQESESVREIFEKTPNAAIDLFSGVCDWIDVNFIGS